MSSSQGARRFGSPVLLALAAFLAVEAEAPRPLLAQKQPTPKRQMVIPNQYVGPGSCAASACHGGVQPSTRASVLQNEYSTWLTQDQHAKAYRSLETPVAMRMGKILGIGDPRQSQRCLTCHALAVPTVQRARDFEIAEGVSCESCHGPASGWLGPHVIKGWTTEQSVAAGMVDTKSIRNRTAKCLECHLGTAERIVDHEMIAAGHPDLVFELDSYSAVMPPHWKQVPDNTAGAKVWAVGQAVKLREALRRLARRAESGTWPEYAELDCFACHHPLDKAENSWRQQRGYEDRRPGVPAWNVAHYSVLRAAMTALNPELSKQLESELQAVFRLTSVLQTDRKELTARANQAAGLADQIAGTLNTMSYDRAATGRMLRAIIARTDDIALTDARSAEQAAMAIDGLYLAFEGGAPRTAPTRREIDALFEQLKNPSAYNGPRFAAQMKRVGATLSQ